MTVVVAAVLERGGKILIAQRKIGGPHSLKWEFPGGKVDAGETEPAALRRELQEELGIEAQIGPPITQYEYSYPGRPPILLAFYRVVDFCGEPSNRVFQQIAWAPAAGLAGYDFLEGDAGILKALGK